MKHFIKKIALFLIPLLVFLVIGVGSFYYYDPFNILSEKQYFEENIVGYNEEFVATERFLKNPKRYHSFMFGSSRAGCGFRVEDWAAMIKNQPDSLYYFGASRETIFGIHGKIKLIDELGGQINNALIIVDTDETFHSYENSKGHLYIKHYRTTQTTKASYVTTFLKDYIFSGFFIRFLDYKIFKTQRPYMEGFLDFGKLGKKIEHQLFNVADRIQSIQADSILYYKDKAKLFYERPENPIVNKPIITGRGVEYLKEIKQIFDKHQTSYKWVIGPLYDQHKMNPADLNLLKNVFGEENIYDFSGKNKYTEKKGYYFETSHYRPFVGRNVLEAVYE